MPYTFAIRFTNFLNGQMTFFRHILEFPTREISDSTILDRHPIVFDFSTPPPVKYTLIPACHWGTITSSTAGAFASVFTDTRLERA